MAMMIAATVPAMAGGTPDGAAIFKANCAICHGADGKKVNKVMKIQDLTSPAVQEKSDEELAGVTANGKGKMPGFKSRLSADEIQAVISHIRALAE